VQARATGVVRRGERCVAGRLVVDLADQHALGVAIARCSIR
jgi:hypothetical protein